MNKIYKNTSKGYKSCLVDKNQLVVISDDVLDGALVEGVRYHSPSHMSGWWLTSKNYSGNTDDLKLVHASHIFENRKDLIKFLDLPYGFRFFQKDYVKSGSDEDIWFDVNVADTE